MRTFRANLANMKGLNVRAVVSPFSTTPQQPRPLWTPRTASNKSCKFDWMLQAKPAEKRETPDVEIPFPNFPSLEEENENPSPSPPPSEPNNPMPDDLPTNRPSKVSFLHCRLRIALS